MLCSVPRGESRKSVTLYYYTISDTAVAHATAWKSRPDDTKGKAAMIWADRQVTTAYSNIKSKLGLSDDFVSCVLAFFSRKTVGVLSRRAALNRKCSVSQLTKRWLGLDPGRRHFGRVVLDPPEPIGLCMNTTSGTLHQRRRSIQRTYGMKQVWKVFTRILHGLRRTTSSGRFLPEIDGVRFLSIS
jgi:hypothetical protein